MKERKLYLQNKCNTLFNNLGNKYGIYFSHLFTVLLSVFILKKFILLNSNDESTGFIFLALSYISPIIIFSNFGLRQIIILNKIKYIPIDLLLFRILFSAIIFFGISFFIPGDFIFLFSMIFFWKLLDSITETIHAKLIYEQKYLKLAIYSLIRLTIIFLTIQFISFFLALFIGYLLYLTILLYGNNIKFHYNWFKVIYSGTILSLGSLFSSLGSVMPRILTEFYYGIDALASIGAGLYLAGLASNIIGPFQNKIRVTLVNIDDKTFRLFYDKLKKPLFETYTSLFLILLPMLLLWEDIKQLLFGAKILLNKLDFTFIYIGFILFTTLGFIDLVCQVLNKFREILIMRILIILCFVVFYVILFSITKSIAINLFFMYLLTSIVIFFLFKRKLVKWF